MQDGYISEDGKYETGEPGLFGSPVLVREEDSDFAEVVSGSVVELAMYGRTHSEVWRDFISQLSTPEALSQFGRGFISYPDDIRWFLYGVASFATVLGPEAKERNTLTRQAFTRAVTGDGTPSGRLKRGLMFGTFINYTAMRNIAGFTGRLAGGFVTTMTIQILMNRVGLGFLVPDRTVPRFFAFFPPLLTITSVGSVVRLAEKHFDEYGSLDHMGLTDILVSAATGQDDPRGGDRFMRLAGADLGRRLTSAMWSCEADVREANGVSFGDGTVRADALRDEMFRMSSAANAIESDLRYANNDDDFYDALLRAHNLAVRLRTMGCRNDELEIFVLLMDQTVLEYLNLFLDAIDAALVSQAGIYDHWTIVEADLARMQLLNDPDYISSE